MIGERNYPGLLAECRFQRDRLAAENKELREAITPFVEWLNHLEAIAYRRLSDNESPNIDGCPNLGQLRVIRAASGIPAGANTKSNTASGFDERRSESHGGERK